MSLAEISISRPVFATVIVFALILLGIVNYFRMNVNEMPDTSYPYVSVNIPYEGALPDQVDVQVTQKIEAAIGEAKGIKHIESISREGEAEINIEFNFGVEPALAAQEVRDKISSIRGELPEGVKEPIISRLDMNAAPVAAFAITGKNITIREMSIFVEDVIKPRLHKLDGVGQIRIIGVQEREIQLLLEQDKLNAFGLSVVDVTQRLQQVNQDIPAGKMRNDNNELSVRTAGNFKNIDDFYTAVVGIRNQTPIYFDQVGTVKDTVKDITTTARYDAEPAIGIEVGKQSGGNAVKVAMQVKNEIDKIIHELPSGMEIHLVRDDAKRVQESISDVWFDLVVGSVFAVLIVFWFLGDWRSTVISSLTIPASIASTFLFMQLAGFSINSMSLLGLSLSVGLLIDDAIVVIENIIRHSQMGKTAIQAAIDGTKEISLAVMATTFTVAAVFIPVGFMSGVEGQLYKEFGISITFAVLVSLFISFMMTPMMAALYLPVGKTDMSQRIAAPWKKWNQCFQEITKCYEKFLLRVLYIYRNHVLWTAVGMFIFSIMLIPFMGSSFLPVTDQSQFVMKVRSSSGATIQSMDQQAQQLINVIRTIPDVKNIYTTTSGQEHTMFINLSPKKERQCSQNEIISEIRKSMNGIPGIRADFQQGDGKPVAISIIGDSMETLIEISEKAKQNMQSIPGVRDVASSYHRGMPNLNLVIKEEQANDLEVSSASIGSTLHTLLNGNVVGKYSDTDERINIRVRLADSERARYDILEKIFVPSGKQHDGNIMLVPLQQVTEWQYTTSPSDIRRYDRQKEIRLTANLENTNLGAFNDSFFSGTQTMSLPLGYQISATGESADMDDSFSSMGMALLMGIVFIFMILAAQFESYIEPIAIMFSLPLALIGAIIGLFLTGSDLSIVSLIGIMMLMGLVTKNAILLIDVAKQLMKKGFVCEQALAMAGSMRLRPIIMTSIAMIFGMLPIALGIGPGSEARAPMAYAIIGGVLTSTILTLVVVPIIYFLIHKKIIRNDLAIKNIDTYFENNI